MKLKKKGLKRKKIKKEFKISKFKNFFEKEC